MRIAFFVRPKRRKKNTREDWRDTNDGNIFRVCIQSLNVNKPKNKGRRLSKTSCASIDCSIICFFFLLASIRCKMGTQSEEYFSDEIAFDVAILPLAPNARTAIISITNSQKWRNLKKCSCGMLINKENQPHSNHITDGPIPAFSAIKI